MLQNMIIVEGPVDFEETIEGTNFLYSVKSCEVDQEKGKLTWDLVVFPIVSLPPGSLLNDRIPMISRAQPISSHVSTMQQVGDDVLSLLRDRGVEVIIIDNPSPAVTCGD